MDNPNEAHSPRPTLSRTELGEALKKLRRQLRLSQSELAIRAGASLSTVYHVERGRPTRESSIRRICTNGLGAIYEEIAQTRNVGEADELVLYRAHEATWFAASDGRRVIPDDNAERLLDPLERRRLGRLGFVPAFINSPSLAIGGGPSAFFLELHGRFEEEINATIFRNAKVYCQSGAIRCGVGRKTVDLFEGDMIACRCADLHWMEPLNPLSPKDAPSLVLWMGAVKVGEPRHKNLSRSGESASEPA